MNKYPIEQFPHCDPRILHAPGECKYCDAHPDWQELRNQWGINFTGGTDPDRYKCPADAARGDRHETWQGNTVEPRKCKNCRHPKSAHMPNPGLRCIFGPDTKWDPEAL